MKQQVNNLIIVPGHASFTESVQNVPANPEQDKYWVLQPFQHSEPSFYIEHIVCAVELLKKNPCSILVMSGGRTDAEAGHWSEALTYKKIAEAYGYWEKDRAVRAAIEKKVELESFARDSFENLQYSLYGFYRLIGTYPQYITVVGWAFKEERFDFHRESLRIPKDRFSYIGCNNPINLQDVLVGEKKTLQAFQNDPFGKREPLCTKRRERNPYNEPNPYTTCPPIKIV